ncbi:DUF1282 family protein [Candidatus Bipolaricaulota bacterium]|nr:DUF1282 family protein [Candidatus Bipolaricaulota bacterium]
MRLGNNHMPVDSKNDAHHPSQEADQADLESTLLKISLGFKLMFRPGDAWMELSRHQITSFDVLTYLIILFPPAFFARGLGRKMVGASFAHSILEAFFFFFLIGCVTLGCSVIVMMFSNRDQKRMMKPVALMTYSSTPLWIFGLLYLIPVPEIHPYIFLFSFAIAGYLLFRGLFITFGIDAHQTLLIASLTTMMWVITSTIFCHIFLGVLFAYL